MGWEYFIKKPTSRELASIFSTAELRKDTISINILSQKAKINKKPANYWFHSSCRKSFCSQINIEKVMNCKQPTKFEEEITTQCFDFKKELSMNTYYMENLKIKKQKGTHSLDAQI